MLGTDRIRIVLLADTHLGFDCPIRPRVQRRRRGPDFFDNYRRVLRHAAKQRIDLIIHGGDLFFRSRVPGQIVDRAYAPLLECADAGIGVVLVPGNHERSRLPESLYLSHPGIFVFDRPRTFRLELSGARVALAGFPCQRRDVRARFRGLLEQTGWRDARSDVRLLCIHQAVEGARVAGYTFWGGADVIRFDDLPTMFHAVLSGHIHRRQVLMRPGKTDGGELRVIYPGSIERTSFAEKDDPKGFFQIEMERSPDGRWGMVRVEFLPLPARPMVDVHISATLRPRDLKNHLRNAVSRIDADAIVRIRARGPISQAIRNQLTSRFLREVVPESMNVQLAREFIGPQATESA